jgi:hypothetical protein
MFWVHGSLTGSRPYAYLIIRSSVVDPDSLNPDTAGIFVSFLGQKLQKRFHKGRSSYRRSLQPSKEIIQHFKI